MVALISFIMVVWANYSIAFIRKKWAEVDNVEEGISPFGLAGHSKNSHTNIFRFSSIILLACVIAWVLVLFKIQQHNHSVVNNSTASCLYFCVRAAGR